MLGLGFLLAGVFAVAGVGKLRDLEGSLRAVRDFGVPERAAAAIGLLLPLAELTVAVALIFRPTTRWGAVAALALLLAFSVGIANALRRGQQPDCHCFGQIHSAPAGLGTLARNAVLAVLALVILVEGPGPAVDDWVSARTAAELAAVGVGAVAVALALLSLYLWRDRKELGLALGSAQVIANTAPPGIPVGTRAPEFTVKGLDGEKVTFASLRERGLPLLLVFVSPGCQSCVELLPKLARWQRTLTERLTIALISSGKAGDHDAWMGQHGLQNIFLQERAEVMERFRIRATPSAVIVTLDGKVGSKPAESVFGIEPLLRLALRDGADAQLAEGSSA